jgi:thymidylate synthase
MPNNLDKQYLDLLQDIMNNGVKKEDRTGTGTLSVFGRQIRHRMSDGFPILTTKKVAFKTMVVELIWFMTGNTNIRYLVENDCHIWDGDSYKAYCKIAGSMEEPDYDVHIEDINANKVRLMTKKEFINKIKTDDGFAQKWGELGPIYGKQWRNWEHYDEIGQHYSSKTKKVEESDILRREPIDQIQNLINDLKTNPDSRRLMVNAWNVADLPNSVLPPCHYGFQVYTRELSLERRYNIWFNRNYETGMEKFFDPNNLPDFDNTYYGPTAKREISLMFNMRSTDVPLGLPFNLASYGLLLTIIAKEVNMIPGELIANLGDAHIYLNQIDGVEEQLGKDISLEERRSRVTQEMHDMIYNAGDPSSLSHKEIDQWGIPRRLERKPYDLPRLSFSKGFKDLMSEDISFSEKIENLRPDFFKLQGYKSHPSIKFPLSN